MFKLIAFITTVIVLASCEDNGLKSDILKHEQLPLTYHFDEKEPNSYLGFKGDIIFDRGCFYSEFYGNRMAIVFPHTFKWDRSLNLVQVNSKTLKPGQKIVGGAVVINRSEFKNPKRHFVSNENCLTDELILLHSYFE